MCDCLFQFDNKAKNYFTNCNLSSVQFFIFEVCGVGVHTNSVFIYLFINHLVFNFFC